MASRVQAFPFEGLPKLPGIAVGRSLGLARGLASLAGLRVVNVRGVGRISLRTESVELWAGQASSLASSPESAFQLTRPDRSAGCLIVERFFALSLVRAALSAAPPPVLRPLGASERGVLAAIVAGALSGAGIAGVQLSLERPRSVDERERVTVTLAARAAAAAGTVVLEAPASWFPSAATSLPMEAALELETTMRVELARTDLAGTACLSAEVGDAVVFEGVSPPSQEGSWTCSVSIGGKSAPASLQPNGELALDGRFASLRDDDMADKPVADGAEGLAILGSAPVEVVAEIGRVPMRGDEVLGLLSGTVLSLGERRRDMVTLRVGGRAWARGELVTVDDALGVRITEILRAR